jgi:hypothetical protein
MISFAMGDRSGSVGMGGKVVELCDSIVGALWHLVVLLSVTPVVQMLHLACPLRTTNPTRDG